MEAATGVVFFGTMPEENRERLENALDFRSGESAVGEDTGILSGTLKMSYFDAKTGKVKTKSIKVGGLTDGGEAVGTATVKGQPEKAFEAMIAE